MSTVQPYAHIAAAVHLQLGATAVLTAGADMACAAAALRSSYRRFRISGILSTEHGAAGSPHS
jgi:hypothetical protein